MTELKTAVSMIIGESARTNASIVLKLPASGIIPATITTMLIRRNVNPLASVAINV